MWDYSNPNELDGEGKEECTCELVFDKFVRFMFKLLRKLKALEVVLFTDSGILQSIRSGLSIVASDLLYRMVAYRARSMDGFIRIISRLRLVVDK